MSAFSPRIAIGSMFALAATAGMAEPIKFTRDGSTYVADVTQQADGSVKIVGHEQFSRAQFVLSVKGNKVTGNYGSTKIAFTTPEAKTLLSSR